MGQDGKKPLLIRPNAHSPSSNPEQPSEFPKRPGPSLPPPRAYPGRREKVKCDRISPCNQCIKTGKKSPHPPHQLYIRQDDQEGSGVESGYGGGGGGIGGDAEMDDAGWSKTTVKNLKGDHPMYNQRTVIGFVFCPPPPPPPTPPSPLVRKNASCRARWGGVGSANAKGGVLEGYYIQARCLGPGEVF